MPAYIGRKAEIGIGKETVRGTAVAPSFWLPKTDLTYDDKVNQAIDESSVGIIEDSTDARITETYAEGSMEGLIRDNSIGLLLLSVFGVEDYSADDPEAGVNTHTFTIGSDAQSQSLTVALKEPNSSKKFALAMIDTLEVKAVVNDFVKFTADFRSKAGASETYTPSYSTGNLFVAQHATFRTAADLAGLGAASDINIISCTLSIAKNVEDDHNLGSLSPSDILNKQVAIEGEIELLYKDTSFITALLSDTPKAMRLQLKNTDVTIGATSNPTLTFELAKAKFSEVTTPFGNDDLVKQTVSFKGFYSLSDALAIQAILINTNAAY